MTSSKKDRNRKGQTQHDGALNVLTGAFRSRRAFRAGVVSTVALLCSMTFPTGTYAQTATTPWIGQNGREIVDLNAKPIVSTTRSKVTTKKKATAKKSNAIRQIRADIPQTEFLPPADPLEENLPFEVEPLADPTKIDHAPLALEPEQAAPQELPPKVIKTVEPAPNYLQGEVAKKTSAPQNVPATLKNSAPAYSNNPYARIGQAEYNPRLFYGTASPNASINGYRNTPPAVAYGQPGVGCPTGCGSQCGDGGCGVFGGFFQNTQLSAGFDSMRSPLDLEDRGNTGADVAVNWGSARPIFGGLHVQAGVRGVFTDLNGESANGFYTERCRSQVFWTTGLYFRANQYSTDGLSMGVVYDSLRDKYYRKYELSQLRAEVSYTCNGAMTLGFRGAFGLSEKWCDLFRTSALLPVEAKAEATDYYAGFARWNFAQGGEATIFGGGTNSKGGIAGGSIEAPLTDCFALKCSGTYLFAKERGLTKREEETWNMSMGLVWYLDGGARNTATSPRPLFDVADNGSFLQNFVRK